MRFFKNKTTLILSSVIVLCFFFGLVAVIFAAIVSTNKSVQEEYSAQTSKIATMVETESDNGSVASLDAVLIKTDESTTATETDDITDPIQSETETQVDGINSFWIEFIDVGQGDSALIQCDGHYMLIDGGPPSASSIVYTILKNKEIDKLDYMIATHPDADHIGGLSGALNFASVGVCYSPVESHDTKTFESLVKYLNKQNASITVPTTGTEFQLGRATVEILGPIHKSDDTNNNSIVTRITVGEVSFLFMGDAELEEEKSLIEAGIGLSCDVLKAGHHGSNTSTSEEFLRKASPKYVVLSVGADNSYGHPAYETLSKLKAFDLQLYRTDLQGDIICESNGKEISFSTEKKISEESLWIAASPSEKTVTQVAVDAIDPKTTEIPDGTKYVLNTNTKKFHLTTCGSVIDILEKNKVYSTDSAESLIAMGYTPCERCNPGETHIHGDPSYEDKKDQDVAAKNTYVLNTKKMKFHRPDCSGVNDIKAKYRKKVTMSRKKIIKKGYKPCKSCNP